MFGTNGRLTLSNPRLSTLWKLPTNLLEPTRISTRSPRRSRTRPARGRRDHLARPQARHHRPQPDPHRHQGRITRADGTLIDYAIVRLPDGQTMMTFLDVTESANYQQRAEGAQRRAGHRRPAEGRVRAERQLRVALAADQHHRLCRPAGLGDGRPAQRAAARLHRLHPRLERHAGRADRQHPRSRDGRCRHRRAAPRAAGRRGAGREGAGRPCRDFPRGRRRASINLEVDIAPNLPPFIADGTRIVQVLYNLLSSAARFSEPGGEIKLSVVGRAASACCSSSRTRARR